MENTAVNELKRLRADLYIEKLIKSNFGSKKTQANRDLIVTLKQFSLLTDISVFENDVIISKKYPTFGVTVVMNRWCKISRISFDTDFMSNWITATNEYCIKNPKKLERCFDKLSYTTSVNMLANLKDVIDTDKFIEQIIYR